MQIIEKAVNGAEITKNVTSKADVKKWFVKHHSDKLTNHQKEHLAKDLEASAAHSRMTEFLKLWDLVCPDEPKAPAAQVGDSSLATDVDAEID